MSLRSDLSSSGPTTVMSEGTKNIVEAMKARGIRKVVGCMSGTMPQCKNYKRVAVMWLIWSLKKYLEMRFLFNSLLDTFVTYLTAFSFWEWSWRLIKTIRKKANKNFIYVTNFCAKETTGSELLYFSLLLFHLYSLSSSFSLSPPAFLLWDRSKVPPRMIPVTEDHDRMHTVLKTSGLDYVAVMPPHIGGQ